MNKKILIYCLSLFILMSCAGLLTGYDARKSFEQGMALFNQGKYSDALPYFEKASELEPEYTQAYIYLGRTHLNLRQWTQAIQPLRTAYRLSPGETRREALKFSAGRAHRRGPCRTEAGQLQQLHRVPQGGP